MSVMDGRGVARDWARLIDGLLLGSIVIFGFCLSLGLAFWLLLAGMIYGCVTVARYISIALSKTE
jgi:hypothetical protein